MRVGSGFDVHRLEHAQQPGEMILGGVPIATDLVVVAHSDGDVVLHALMDAILGAAGKGDIGQHFLDSDPRYAGADSGELLMQVLALVAPLAVVNADITIVAEAPKIGPHRDAMRTRIAELIGTAADRVNVKATTTEGLGFTGRGEGLAVQVSVLLDDDSRVNG